MGVSRDLGASLSANGLCSAEAPEPCGLGPTGAIPSAAPREFENALWINYNYERNLDFSERGAGFIEGFASALASLSYALCDYPDAGKSYDPLSVELRRGTMHSYVFNMKDGGRHHPMAEYRTYRDVCDCLFHETLEGIAQDYDLAATRLRRLASAIEAPSGVETGNTDSTEGESAVPQGDAQ